MLCGQEREEVRNLVKPGGGSGREVDMLAGNDLRNVLAAGLVHRADTIWPRVFASVAK